MPGPQLVSAVRLSKALRAQHPDVPLVWGGNFGSLYPSPVLNAPYVDWLVRGQGEHTFVDLIEVDVHLEVAENTEPRRVQQLRQLAERLCVTADTLRSGVPIKVSYPA